jgi:hypothetical protein
LIIEASVVVAEKVNVASEQVRTRRRKIMVPKTNFFAIAFSLK